MRAALARHDELLRTAVAEHGGTVFSTHGRRDRGRVRLGVVGGRAPRWPPSGWLDGEAWPTATPIRVRMGLHTGEAELRDGDYFGTAVNRAARLMAVGHGGQVLCSSVTAELVGDAVALVDLGEHRLRDLDRPMRVFQVGDGGVRAVAVVGRAAGEPAVAGHARSWAAQAELAAVAKDLGSARLVTLTGVGGVGKTRLALQVAAELLPGLRATGRGCASWPRRPPATTWPRWSAIALGVVQRQQMSLGRVDRRFPAHPPDAGGVGQLRASARRRRRAGRGDPGRRARGADPGHQPGGVGDRRRAGAAAALAGRVRPTAPERRATRWCCSPSGPGRWIPTSSLDATVGAGGGGDLPAAGWDPVGDRVGRGPGGGDGPGRDRRASR